MLRRAELLRQRRKKKGLHSTKIHFSLWSLHSLKTKQEIWEFKERTRRVIFNKYIETIIGMWICCGSSRQSSNWRNGPSRWREVQEVVCCARAVLSPGPKGVPCWVYKGAPDVLKYLWKLMVNVWKKGAILRMCRACGIFNQLIWMTWRRWQQLLHVPVGCWPSWMTVIPSKCRTVYTSKGKTGEREVLYIDGEVIPSIVEKPVKSLGRWYYSTSSDRGQVSELRWFIVKAISTIDKTFLPGKLKLRNGGRWLLALLAILDPRYSMRMSPVRCTLLLYPAAQDLWLGSYFNG